MQEDKSKIKILVYDDYNKLKSLIQDFSDSVDIENVEDKANLNDSFSSEVQKVDVVVFDSADNFSFDWQDAAKIKEVNPGAKTIMFTSMKNRKFRRHYLSRGVDYFMFKETEGSLLKSIVKQIHTSKTRRKI